MPLLPLIGDKGEKATRIACPQPFGKLFIVISLRDGPMTGFFW